MSSSTQQQLTRLAAAWCLAWPAWAQVVPPTTLATPTPTTSPATAPTASAPTASAPTAGPAPASPANAADCARLTDEAMAADLALANAQSSDKQDPQQLASQVDKAMALWTQAGQACTGRAQERALRNLRDNQRLRDNLRPQLDAAPACTRSQHDATQLQDMAQQALRERRWLDAAMLYRKAENSWDLATERCTGKLQQQAQLKRSQTAEDAHNAEFCAPAFEKARDYTKQFRQTSASLSAIDKQTQSLAAETLWRNAESQCIGNAQTLARSNGQNLNKERGTPWIATQPPVVASNAATAGGAGTANGASTPAAAGSATAATTASAGTPGSTAGTTTAGTSDSSGNAEPPKATLPWKDINLTVSGTHYQGRFQQNGSKISGSGEVKWANGDRYQGELQDTQPHGQGEFTWANGQRYQGQWVKGVPQGSGQLAFANGNQYQGEVVNGVPQGRGTLRYASGDSFEGLFEQGQPAGSGIYRWASGQSYEGPWRNGQPEGQGTLRFVNGNQYQGQLVAGQPEGEGRMTYAWGDRYQGGFAAGVPHGSGRYDWKNGDHYEGQWQHGKKHGQGSMTWANGDHWQGRFEQDQQTADGVLTRASGEAPSPGPQAAITKPQATPQAGTATPAP